MNLLNPSWLIKILSLSINNNTFSLLVLCLNSTKQASLRKPANAGAYQCPYQFLPVICSSSCTALMPDCIIISMHGMLVVICHRSALWMTTKSLLGRPMELIRSSPSSPLPRSWTALMIWPLMWSQCSRFNARARFAIADLTSARVITASPAF